MKIRDVKCVFVCQTQEGDMMFSWADQCEAKETTCTVVYHNHLVDDNSTHTVIFVRVHVWINSRQKEN